MKRIAVIGSGISGLGAAWALAGDNQVTVYEAADRPGGHANTVDVAQGDTTRSVDTGFLVYNTVNYPNLIRLFDRLGVATEPSDMSFAVSMDGGALEYAGSARGLIAQRRNILRPRVWSLVRDALRFFKQAPAWLAANRLSAMPLGEYLERGGYGRPFVEDHLVPMAAAIWSCPDQEILDFPAASILAFLENHRLLQLGERPRWRTVSGGSRHYVRAVTAAFGDRLHLGTPVRAIRRDPAGVSVTTDGGTARFDTVVLATHADQALAILGDDATPVEREVLGAFRYSANDTWLHSDPSLMPTRREVWSSWNYLGRRGRGDDGRGARVSVSYWLNRLQNLPAPDLFVTLNPLHEPEPGLTHMRMRYDHPVFDGAAIQAQRRLGELQGRQATWFCGSYFGYGFHEDGLEAGLAVADSLGSPAPWAHEVTPASPADAHARPIPDMPAAAA
jgi:hypothetical protein